MEQAGFENNPEQKIDLRSEFIRVFQEKGENDSETRALSGRLIDELQEQAGQAESSDLGGARVSFVLASVYFEVGLIEDARDCLEQAIYQVEEAKIDDTRKEALCGEILREMEKRGFLGEGWRSPQWAIRGEVNFLK